MKQTVWQLVLFGMVGITALVIDTGVTYVLVQQGVPVYIASAVGFVAGFAFNFPVNRQRVFQHSPHDRYSLRTQIALYAGLSLFNLGATSLAVQGLVQFGVLPLVWAKTSVTALFAIWNFVVLRLVIFAKRPH